MLNEVGQENAKNISELFDLCRDRIEEKVRTHRNILSELKSDVLKKYPRVQELGLFWWFKVRGLKLEEHTVVVRLDTPGFTENHKINFISVSFEGTKYWRRWGKLAHPC